PSSVKVLRRPSGIRMSGPSRASTRGAPEKFRRKEGPEQHHMTSATVETAANAGGGMDSFAALFEQSVEGGDFAREGEIISGTVVQVGRDSVVVDIGGKSEGVISLREFADAGGQAQVKPGDKVDVYIESRENDDGLVTLSKEKADKMKV